MPRKISHFLPASINSLWLFYRTNFSPKLLYTFTSRLESRKIQIIKILSHFPSHSTGSSRYSEVMLAGSFSLWSSQDWPKKISAAYVCKMKIEKIITLACVLTMDPSLILSKLITVTWNSTLVGWPDQIKETLQNNLLFPNTEVSHSLWSWVIPGPQYRDEWRKPIRALDSIPIPRYPRILRQKLDGIDISFCL